MLISPRDAATPRPRDAAPLSRRRMRAKDEPRRVLAIAAGWVLAACLRGVLALHVVIASGFDEPRGSNIFFVLFARHELPFLVLTALFAAACVALRSRHQLPGDSLPQVPAPSPLAVALLAMGVLAVGWLAGTEVFHHYALSMDEYSAQFQARIFASGRLAAPLPVPFRQVSYAITPIFSTYLPRSGSWVSMYLPVYSALRALLMLLGAEWLTNPLLSAASVVLVAAVSRRLWPGAGGRQWLALLLLVTSCQFLITAGTAYSMPAHLCLNLLWLLLWLRGDRRSLVALPIVGVLALGLHNPFPHALFVAPFLVRLVWSRRWRLVAWTGSVYALGSLFWLRWLLAVQPDAQHGGAGGLVSMFHLPTATMFAIQAMNLALFTTWQTPLVALGLGCALWRVRSLPSPMRELAHGVMLTCAFYFFFPTAQGHGWGYRYLFPVLGSIVLLAADGWLALSRELRPRAARLLLAGGLALVCIELPIRAVETERIVRPFAAASAYLHSLPADVVVLPPGTWWYGQDLVRNDPLFRDGPVIIASQNITEERYQALVRELGPLHGRDRGVSFPELARFGMVPPFRDITSRATKP